MAVVLETSLGDITLDLYTDERPKCCLNFLKLCKTKYYNYCIFHSVQKNLVAQTGDPTMTGKGGASIYNKLYGDQARYFEQEAKPRIKHTKLGTLSMVNNGENMHGSQFFLTLRDGLDYLDGVHTVFGEVAEGFDVIDKINQAFCDEAHRPYRDIRIYHTVVLDDPFDDPAGLEEYIPDRSPEPTREQLDTGRIGADEEIDDSKGRTMEEIDEEMAAREAGANAQLLEMIGDIPDAEIAPEDNVLFVCKLNQVTTSEDLEIIFSRFGTILSCEVIKDHKSGESLQYAFIEFEKVKDCETAYFKMDNVLIDDRRIHVDFSQSVSKLRWKGNNKFKDMTFLSNKSEDPENPNYAIRREKNRQDGNKYDLVFDEEEKRKGRKSEKQRDRKSSRSPPKPSRLDREKEKSPGRRRSKERSPKRRRSRDRRPSPERRRSRDRGSPKRRRSRERRRSHDRRRSRDRRRSPSPSRRRSRSRDRKRRRSRSTSS